MGRKDFRVEETHELFTRALEKMYRRAYAVVCEKEGDVTLEEEEDREEEKRIHTHLQMKARKGGQGKHIWMQRAERIELNKDEPMKIRKRRT